MRHLKNGTPSGIEKEKRIDLGDGVLPETVLAARIMYKNLGLVTQYCESSD